MKVAVLGSGQVGQVLAEGFLKHGHEVMRASREPKKLESWLSAGGKGARLGTFAEAARWGEVIVLAVKGAAAEAVLDGAGVDALAGKTIIDTTNPIDEKRPPEHGVLHYFTNLDESLMERLQKKAPQAHFVKAFSCVGNARMVNPTLAGGPPTMFICGNDAGAKSQVKSILDQFGWATSDMGGAAAARAIEPLCMLWCIPGFVANSWGHAFKLLT